MSLQTTEHITQFEPPSLNSICETYYKKVVKAETKTQGSKSCPLIVVNGGPLLSHHYCLLLEQLANNPNITSLIFYDPIGCGRSTHIDANSKNFSRDFWKITIAQLKSLIDDLGLSTSGVYLFGHSLGSVIASTYAAENPDSVKALILSASTASVADLVAANLQLLKTFPAEVGETILDFEEFCLGRRGETQVSQEKYLAAVATVRNKHFNRRTPPTEYFEASVAACMEVFPTYADIAGGTVMFLWSGPVVDHDTRSILPQITAPTLVIKGEYDQCLPSCQEPFLQLIPNVQQLTLKNASHMVTEEVTEQLMEVIGNFLAQLER